MKKESVMVVLLLLVMQAAYINGMDGLISQACTVASKVDVSLDMVQTVESNLCVLEISLPTLDSKIDEIDLSGSLLAKACTVESRVDEAQLEVSTIESKIDEQAASVDTVESKIDEIDLTISSAFSKACTLDSQVDVAFDTIGTIDSLLDVLEAIESKVDTISQEEALLESKLCVIDSKVDQALITSDTIQSELDSIESSVDALYDKIITVSTDASSLESNLDFIDASLETVLMQSSSTESKLCVIDSRTDLIDNTLDAIKSIITSSNDKSLELIYDFAQTWTALVPIESSLCSALSKTDLISSLVDQIGFSADLSPTYTAIAAILEKACDTEDVITSIQNQITRLTLFSLETSFTVQDDTVAKLCTSESILDELSVTVTVLDPLQNCLGTPIRQADVGAAGYTITESGSYYLAENIAFAPGVGANAITIAADDVHLNLNGKAMEQADNVSGVFGVVVDGSRSNIAIVTGQINRFRGEGIFCIDGVENLLIDSILLQNSGAGTGGSPDGTDGIQIASCMNVVIRNTEVLNSEDEALDINSSTYVLIDNCVLSESNSSSGLQIEDCSDVWVRNCNISGNFRNGMEFSGANAPLRVVVQSCVISGNEENGVGLLGGAQGAQDLVFENNVIEANGLRGIVIVSNAESNPALRNVIRNNVISNNGLYGIYLSGGDFAINRNNLILFNSFVENGFFNVFEDPTGDEDTGPNTYLGNFAYHSGGDIRNYRLSLTSLAGSKTIISQSGAFPTPLPTYWYNISMIP